MTAREWNEHLEQTFEPLLPHAIQNDLVFEPLLPPLPAPKLEFIFDREKFRDTFAALVGAWKGLAKELAADPPEQPDFHFESISTKLLPAEDWNLDLVPGKAVANPAKIEIDSVKLAALKESIRPLLPSWRAIPWPAFVTNPLPQIPQLEFRAETSFASLIPPQDWNLDLPPGRASANPTKIAIDPVKLAALKESLRPLLPSWRTIPWPEFVTNPLPQEPQLEFHPENSFAALIPSADWNLDLTPGKAIASLAKIEIDPIKLAGLKESIRPLLPSWRAIPWPAFVTNPLPKEPQWEFHAEISFAALIPTEDWNLNLAPGRASANPAKIEIDPVKLADLKESLRPLLPSWRAIPWPAFVTNPLPQEPQLEFRAENSFTALIPAEDWTLNLAPGRASANPAKTEIDPAKLAAAKKALLPLLPSWRAIPWPEFVTRPLPKDPQLEFNAEISLAPLPLSEGSWLNRSPGQAIRLIYEEADPAETFQLLDFNTLFSPLLAARTGFARAIPIVTPAKTSVVQATPAQSPAALGPVQALEPAAPPSIPFDFASAFAPLLEDAFTFVPGTGKRQPAALSPETVAIEPPIPEPVIEEPVQLTLNVEKTSLAPGESAVLSIDGPDSFLNGSYAEYSVTDRLGRQIERGRVDLGATRPDAGPGRRFKIDPPAALALKPQNDFSNTLQLRADIEVFSTRHRSYKLGTELTVSRPAEIPSAEWNRFLPFIASPPADGNWQSLNRLGIFAGMQYRLSAARRESLHKGNAAFYVENVSRQLLSRYHTEPGLWPRTIETMLANPGSTAPLYRDPSLCAQTFADQYAAELSKVSDTYALDPPLFFSLSSEPSMTRLSAAADFDFSPATLDEFRRWLEREAYGTLPALNEQWGTKFDSWKAVLPMTTDEVRVRLKAADFNFGPWIDFRMFCDYTFARVLRDGAEVLRQRVPGTRVGITGAMGPAAFGGWDWSQLAPQLDVVEAYDIGGARALWRDLAPGKAALASIDLPAGGGKQAAGEIAKVLWPFMLEGGPRGAVFWDTPAATDPPAASPGSPLFDSSGTPTELATALASLLNNTKAPAVRLATYGKRAGDGVAILYSPASIRMYWLFEVEKLHPGAWLQTWGADSSAERRESTQLRLRESWCKLLDDIGVGWRFVSSDELERGLLHRDASITTIVLPRTVALSDREAEAIRQFAAAGGHVIADAACGRFDEHGKLRPKPALDEVFGVITVSEPLFARPMNTLEHVSRLPNSEGFLGQCTQDDLNHLPPAFSDEPKWAVTERSGQRRGAEYRMSPMLASSGTALYLNLDLTDYLRWRLQPDPRRAQVIRRMLSELAFRGNLDSAPIDLSQSKIPWGTQIVRLDLESGTSLLALRRNPQARLHELGADGDSNTAFDKSEPFEIHLRKPAWLGPEFPASPRIPDRENAPVETLAGMLDPVTPSLFVLHRAASAALPLLVEKRAQRLAPCTLVVRPSQPPAPALYRIAVFAPDGTERLHYGGLVDSKDGALKHAVVFALNDPGGTWSCEVHELISGSLAKETIELDSERPEAPAANLRPKNKALPEPDNE